MGRNPAGCRARPGQPFHSTPSSPCFCAAHEAAHQASFHEAQRWPARIGVVISGRESASPKENFPHSVLHKNPLNPNQKQDQSSVRDRYGFGNLRAMVGTNNNYK
jgi:hypothetical protein